MFRGDPFITFAPRGGRGVRKVANCANDSTDRLRENANEGGEGVQNPENFANVINGCPLRGRWPCFFVLSLPVSEMHLTMRPFPASGHESPSPAYLQLCPTSLGHMESV